MHARDKETNHLEQLIEGDSWVNPLYNNLKNNHQFPCEVTN